MNIPITPTPPKPEYLFRGADRMRIEGCVNAISRENLSLALFAEHEALLDHYAELLVQRLRRLGQDLQVEVYFPTNTESLLARFNEALAHQSVESAVQAGTSGAPTRIWLVHDAQLLPAHELQLMARLMQNFPGANIRAMLLVSGNSFDRELLSAFGRKILRWDIETPTPEQAQALLEQARAEGHGEAIDRLIRRLGRQQPPSIEALAEQAQAAEDLVAQVRAAHQTRTGSNLAAGTAGVTGWAQAALKAFRPLQSGRSLSRGVLLGAGALLASTMLMAWLQPQAFGLDTAHETDAQHPPAVVPLAGPAAGVTVDSSQPVASPAPAMAAASTALPVAAGATSAANAPADNGPAAAAASRTPATPAPASPAETQTGPDRNNPRQAWASHDWVRGLEAGSFVIQYGSSGTYAGALALQQRFPGLANARIVAFTRPGERNVRFAVVSGPYSPSAQAEDKLRNLGNIAPPTSWVRSTRDLQSSLAPARPQESRT